MAPKQRKLAAIFLALALCSVPARADFIWNDATGDWFTPGNWTPPGPPGSGQHAQINNGGTAQVTSAGAVCNILTLGHSAGDSGTVDVSGSGTLTTSSEVYVGLDGVGVMDITGGGDVSSTFGVIANSTGSTGTVDVDGTGSTWTLRSQFLEVGGSGTGSLNITNGGAVSVATGSTIGLYGMGTATVNGTGSTWTNTLSMVVGYSGNGTLNIQNGGSVSNTSATIGQNTSGVGVVNVTGKGSTWTNSAEVNVGYDGHGTLNITSGGAVTVGGSFLRIGVHPTAVGTVLLDGSGSSLTVAHEVDVGREGTGTLTIQNGATFTATGMDRASIGAAPGSNGTATVDGSGSTWSMNGGLFVGDSGTGALNVTNGGTVSNAFAQIGSQPDSMGAVLVDGTGSTWTINGTFIVGNGGTGALTITNGGAVASNGGFSFLGADSTGDGTVIVDGAMSTWSAHNVFVGGDTGQAQGTGLLSVTNGGLVTATAVTIWQTGTLEGNGTIASNVTSFGLVDPGTANPGTLTITGNYTQHSSGTLKIDIGGLTSGVDSDLLQVNGAGGASLDGTLQLVRVNNFTPAPGDRVNIIDDPSGHTGTFSSLDYVNWGLIRPVPMYDEPNDVYVVFELSGTFESQAQTPNQRAVGNALDHAFADECLPLFTFGVLGNLPLADLPQAFNLIAPEEMAAMYEISFSRATVQSQNLQRRMDQIREAADPNCGPLVETNPAPIQDKNVAGKDVVPPAPAPEPETRFGTFALGSGDYVTVHDNDENASGYKIRNGSFLGGFDYRLLHNFALGVYGGYVGSESELAGHGRIISDGGTVGGYATFFSHGFYLQGGGGAGWNTYDNLRQGFFGVTHGKTDGTELNAMGALGYDWSMNFNAANHPGSLIIGPTASVQYTSVDLDGYREHGSLIPLEFPDQSEDSLRSTIGGKAMICLQTDHGLMLRPEVRVAWLHEYNDRSYPISARFLGCPTIFTVHGPAVGGDAALVNAGLTIQFNPTVALFGHYDGIFGRDNYDNNSVSGGISLSF